MKLAVERSIMMEWIFQLHLPSDPRETSSRSWLSVSSLLEPIVVVSPSCSSDIHPKLVQSWSPPFRYSHLEWPSGVRGVVGMTNTVPFSLSVHACSSSVTSPSRHVSRQRPASSSTENTGTLDCCLAAFCARLCREIRERNGSNLFKVWEYVLSKAIYLMHCNLQDFGTNFAFCRQCDGQETPKIILVLFIQLHYTFPPHYLSLGLPFCSSLSPLLSTFLFGLLPPLIDNHFTDVKPTLKTDKEEKLKKKTYKNITKGMKSRNNWFGEELIYK